MRFVTAFALAIALPLAALAEEAGEKKGPEPAKTPEECYALACKALCDGEGDTYWFCLSRETRKQLIAQAEEAKKNHAKELAAALKVTEEELAKIEPRDVALRQVLGAMNDEVRKMLKKQKLSAVKIDGEKATGTLEIDGDLSPIEFVKEDEGWRIDASDSEGHEHEHEDGGK
ncbi:MAG: hypothetical protein AAB074_12600 [Planctomycetota bacterium]